MARVKIAAGNWKMNKTPDETRAFIKEFAPLVKPTPKLSIVLFPPHICLAAALEITRDLKISVGAQNCYFEAQGAFTGETSPKVLAAMGSKYTLVGHSERRSLFGETDEMLSKKVKAAQLAGLEPMLCVGETLSEREAQKTNEVIERQLREGLKLANLENSFSIAYEPVWAIGTGKVATPEQASEAHSHLRRVLSDICGTNRAEEISILYGGSVKSSNAQELASKPNIDGFLVGGASLEPLEFSKIAQSLS